MGTHAERVAIRDGVSPRGPGRVRARSHRRAVAAQDAGRFDAEMAPVTVRDAKGRETHRRRPTRARGATPRSRPSPASRRPSTCPRARIAADATVGTVTAGNAPGITDGAAAIVVASERAVEAHGLPPLARIVGYAQAEVAPEVAVPRPGPGRPRAWSGGRASPLGDYDLVEMNEAFAAQVLADGRELGLDWSRVNVNGGAIALGHPIGASGARIVATLLHELARRGGRFGLATLCLGGGGSVAMAVERV